MLEKAYGAQCKELQVTSQGAFSQRQRQLALFALSFGSFCIGSSEFASMGILQLFSASLGIGIPTATHAITAYAMGVVIGAPLVTLSLARLNRRTLLLFLMGLFAAGNLLSAMAPNIGTLAVARFISGLPQGAYFGAGAVVASYIVGPGNSGRAFALVMTGLTVATIFGAPLATFLGETLGWRNTYSVIGGMSVLALGSLWAWTPRTSSLEGGLVVQELNSLRKSSVWMTMAVAAIGVASIFAVYTFIGPLTTDVALLNSRAIPFALAIFGTGMAVGNLLGGRLADRHNSLGLVIGFGGALIVLALLASLGQYPITLLGSLFGVGATMMIAIPTIQVRLTRLAPEAPTLMGAMNLASLNVANAIGAWAGSVTIGAGLGLLSTVWDGFGLTAVGLLMFVFLIPAVSRLTSGTRISGIGSGAID